MPKGAPNKNTIRVERYQKKAGYHVKAFKLKGDIADRFAEACKSANLSQAAVITELMQEFIDRQKDGSQMGC